VRYQKPGVSFIEVLIALMLCAVIFSAVLPLIQNTIYQNQQTKQRLLATEAASNEIEKFKESKIVSLCPLPQVSCDSIFVVDGIANSSGKIKITKPQADNRLAAIKVTIDWSFRGRAQNVTLNTYMYGGME